MGRRAGVLALVGLGLLAAPAAAEPPAAGYHGRVRVAAPTRLDWTFAASNRSQAEPPAKWLGDYDSAKQEYELFVPARRDRKARLPLIVFISASNDPAGWRHFQRLCKARGFLFAGPRGAGNDCPEPKRARIVLDVLDDVRRHYPTDPDRTYLAGVSGGARMACAIAFALPEHFGGVLSLIAGGDLRQEPWLRQRVIDRLSVALLTGTKDFNHGEVTRWRGPQLQEVGVQARVWVQPGLGHAIPAEKYLGEALRWLDDGLKARRDLARRYPASRVAGDKGPGREALARALLDEGRGRLAKKETLYSGLMQLKGCHERWPDLEAGRAAEKILLEYQEKPERPWEADDVAEQRRFLVAQARALDRYVSVPLEAPYAKMRPGLARRAIALWERVERDSPDSPAGKEAKKRIPELRKLLPAEG
jgi:dipeptidyl aminopeptidase/acylaminoacyl peptidase